MRSSMLLLLLTLFVAACGGGPPGGGPPGDEEAEEDEGHKDDRVLVEVATVARGSVADHLVTSGTLEGESQADIVPEASGVVRQILAEEGDLVQKGQVLAVLSNPSLEAGADRADLELSRARREADQAQRLHAQGAVSDRELREAQTALKNAETTYTEAARTRGFTRIESPISGTVSVRDIRVGEVAGGTRAFQVVDLERLRVIVQLPEKDLPRIAQGQTAVLQGAYDEEARVQGVVSRISPVVDPMSGTVRVTIDVDADQSVLRPGQFAKVRIEIARHDDVITMPRKALQWEDGEPFAWRVVDAPPETPDDRGEGGDGEDGEEADEPGFLAGIFGGDEDAQDDAGKDAGPPPWPQRRPEKVPLTVGFTDPDLAEVSQGLDVGDLVVTVGGNNLRDDTPVRLPDDPVGDELEDVQADGDTPPAAEDAEATKTDDTTTEKAGG